MGLLDFRGRLNGAGVVNKSLHRERRCVCPCVCVLVCRLCCWNCHHCLAGKQAFKPLIVTVTARMGTCPRLRVGVAVEWRIEETDLEISCEPKQVGEP
jgi:hypothetical protein